MMQGCDAMLQCCSPSSARGAQPPWDSRQAAWSTGLPEPNGMTQES